MRSMPWKANVWNWDLDYYDDPVSLWQRKHLRGDLFGRSTKEREDERTGIGAVSLRRSAHSAASVPYWVHTPPRGKPGIPTEIDVLVTTELY